MAARRGEETVIVEPGRLAYAVETGKRVVFRRVPNVMTVSFLLDRSAVSDQDYPRYVLESADGAYRVERTPRDDLVQGDRYLDLRFEGLLPGKTYTLTRWLDAESSEVVFCDVPWARIVDQPRATAELVEDCRFARGGGGAAERAELEQAKEDGR